MISRRERDREHPIAWRLLLRDAGIVGVLVLLAFELFAQAEKRGPPFAVEDIRVVEAAVAGFTTVQVWETAAAPNVNSQALVSRSAFRIDDFPPNLLAYIPGSPWQMEGDIPVGAVARLEVAEGPEALTAQTRAFPETVYLLPIEGLRVGDRVYFRAGEEIERAEEAARRYQILGFGAVMAALGWLGWRFWSRRRELGRLLETS